MIRIFGTMTDPSGSPVPGAIIELRAINSTSEVLLGSTVNHKCDQQGAYSFQLAAGMYDAYAQNDRCGDMDYLGTAKVSANSVDGDLHSILIDGGINITPPMLDSALAAAQRAESAAERTAADMAITGQNAESAKADSATAKTSKDEAVSAASTAVSAKDSIFSDARDVRHLAVQVADQAADVSSKHGDVVAKAGQISSQADAVSTKYAEVVTKAAQVSDDASATQSAKNISVAAADTATQKAASAATHDASAQDAAIRAENAASAVVGAVLDGGECDLSSGIYPQPITVAGKKYSTIWYVAIAGSVSGVSFDVGDLLRYTTAKEGYYFKVDAKDDVYSVNGEKGPVTITPEKIGAEKAGTAQLLIDQHSAKTKAHHISGVDGLLEALDYKYSPENKPPSDFFPGEPRMFETRLQLSKRGAEYHPLDGQTVPRIGDAALLAAIIAGEVPSCSDADWLADPLKRSNYTLGDGSTTIRLPDRNGQSSGTAGAVFARGDGTHAPLAGAIHGDATRRVTTSITLHWADEANIIGAVSGAGKGTRGNSTKYRSTFNLPVTDGAGSFGEVSLDNSLQVPTADENRPTSISQVWAVKR
ncbi:prophage tail fiber N-terminal domain-containing protein [Aeromonas veronii]